MKDYHAQLAQDGSYRSPESHQAPSPAQRFFGRSVSFYANYFARVLKALALARAGKYDDQTWMKQAWDLIKLMERHGGRFEVSGLHNLRGQGAMVLAANHMSTMETQILTALVTPFCPITFVVKENLCRGLYSPLITARPYIAVSRTNPFKDLEQVLTGGKNILDQGRSVVIFPQGTREPSAFTPRRFNSLATKLAATSGYPLVPVALRTDFWGAGRWIKDLGPIQPDRPVHFAFGSPLTIKGKGKEQQKAAVEFISDQLRQWGVPVNE